MGSCKHEEVVELYPNTVCKGSSLFASPLLLRLIVMAAITSNYIILNSGLYYVPLSIQSGCGHLIRIRQHNNDEIFPTNSKIIKVDIHPQFVYFNNHRKMSSDQQHDVHAKPDYQDQDDDEHRHSSVVSQGKRHSKQIHDQEQHQQQTTTSEQIKSQHLAQNVEATHHHEQQAHEQGHHLIENQPQVVDVPNQNQVLIQSQPENVIQTEKNVMGNHEQHDAHQIQQPKIEQVQMNHGEEQQQNIQQIDSHQEHLNDEQQQQRKSIHNEHHQKQNQNSHQEQPPILYSQEISHPQDDAVQQQPIQENAENLEAHQTEIAVQNEENVVDRTEEKIQNEVQKKEELKNEIVLTKNQQQPVQETQETERKDKQEQKVNSPLQAEQTSEVNILRQTKPLYEQENQEAGESVISRRVLAPSIRDKPKNEQEMGKGSKACTCAVM